jgi:hypothetical protein
MPVAKRRQETGTRMLAPPPEVSRITGRIRADARLERELTWVR